MGISAFVFCVFGMMDVKVWLLHLGHVTPDARGIFEQRSSSPRRLSTTDMSTSISESIPLLGGCIGKPYGSLESLRRSRGCSLAC